MAGLALRLRNVWSSLTFRVLLLLTLTIAPIGAIAVFQTSRLSDALSERATDALLAATLSELTLERVALERALGAGDALSRTVPTQSGTASDCNSTMTAVITGDDGYRFLGLFTPQGFDCVGSPLPRELEGFIKDIATFENTAPFVLVLDQFDLTVIGQPTVFGEAVQHYVLLTMDERVLAKPALVSDARPEIVALFTPSGNIVRSSEGSAGLDQALPAETDLSEATGWLGRVVKAKAQDGSDRVYSVVPVYRQRLYALAIWQPSVAGLPAASASIAPWLFPIFMWLATLTISYIAINRVVVRHVRHLGMHMRRFSRSKMIPPLGMIERQPVEFSEINQNFRAMAQEIVQDRSELENAVHEKTLLLREVHHRVKNNLQLIASIMNMQIRRSGSKETTSALQRLQDRVLGLAAIHRQMYTARALDRVPAKSVVEAILDQVVRFQHSDKVTVSRDLAEFDLVQDQAVPLALLTAEATTNAVENLGTNASGARLLEVVLAKSGGTTAELIIRNTYEDVSEGAEDASGLSETGLGTQLIDAFARQLGGEVTTERHNGVFQLKLTFEIAGDAGSGDAPQGASSETDGGEPGFPLASAASAST